jgi:hypothetical protein
MQLKMIIGTGGLISAIGAEKIVAIFPPKLQKPNAVPAKIAGKIVEFAR